MNNIILICGLTLIANTVVATEIVYQPINQSFGGNPLNGNYLLSNASAQDDNEKPGSRGSADLRAQRSDLDQFNDLLQRSILNRSASAPTLSIISSGFIIFPSDFDIFVPVSSLTVP